MSEKRFTILQFNQLLSCHSGLCRLLGKLIFSHKWVLCWRRRIKYFFVTLEVEQWLDEKRRAVMQIQWNGTLTWAISHLFDDISPKSGNSQPYPNYDCKKTLAEFSEDPTVFGADIVVPERLVAFHLWRGLHKIWP